MGSPIPAHAKEIFHAHIYSVYEREQELFNGKIKPFYGMKMADVAKIIPVVDNKIRLCDEKQPHIGERIGFYGGVIEKGEDPLIGAQRELQEESGLTSDNRIKLTTKHEEYMYQQTHYFIAKDCQQTHDTSMDTGGEIITPKPVSFTQFIEFLENTYLQGRTIFPFAKTSFDKKQLEEFKNLLFT